ncbi:TRAP transporter small permease [Vibrio fluminensis]|uniref:TRAP transporter small permease n=1 Tax=Vibrio fluminensis TaxID=2783614 RepID=UPI001886BC58|nr:TRAP transporter small permease subunit [Vibrio fluminensis]
MLYLKSFNGKVLKWEENIAGICLFLISFLVFFAALLRAVGHPQAWMSDLSQLLFGWVIFLGSDLALSQKRHIGVEFFEEKLPMVWRNRIADIWSISIIGFLGFVAYYGWFLATKSRREFDSLEISEFNVVIFLSISFLCLIAFDFYQSNKKHIQGYLMSLVVLLVFVGYILMNWDVSKQAEPLSYAFLIASVPIGCVLMIRTELVSVLERWSRKNG